MASMGEASMGEALIDACLNGQAREVRRLLSGGADINFVDEEGRTPLMAASRNGHVEVVDMLYSLLRLMSMLLLIVAAPPSTVRHHKGTLS